MVLQTSISVNKTNLQGCGDRHVGSSAAALLFQAVMTNSSWTADHVAQLFWSWQLPAVVHPPCDTAELSRLPLQRKLKRLYLVSLAQVPRSPPPPLLTA